MALPLADPIAQPAPTWMLWALLLLTFFLHVLPMNVVLGGAIIAAVARWRGRGGHAPSAALARSLARALPTTVAATVTLGVAALLFAQVLHGRALFASSVLMAAYWLAVVPLLVLAYYGTYVVSYQGDRPGPWPLTSAIVALLFLVIAFIYVNNLSLAQRPDTLAAAYRAEARGLHLALGDPTLLPRYLHVVLSAVAVAGLFVALLGVVRRAPGGAPDRRGPADAQAVWLIQHGCLWCGAATALNLVAGSWWLLALPKTTIAHFMSRLPAVALFAGVATGMLVAGLAFAAARAAKPLPIVAGTAVTLLVTLLLMVVSRDQLRVISLADAGFASNDWVAPQWPAILLFFALFAAALATIAWMVRAIARSPAR
jgi:hypothetical protein